MKRFVLCLAVLVLGAVAAASAQAAEPFAHRCPTEALEEGAVPGLNHDPRAKKAIVPAGAVSLRLCRYYGFGDAGRQTPKTQARAGDLQDQRVVGGSGLLESLRLEFQELAAAPKEVISCPFDEGAKIDAVFSYRQAKPVFIEIHLSGCQFAIAGVPRARWTTTALLKRLVRLVEGKKAPPHSTRGKIAEKSVAAYPPPHLSLVKAKHQAKGALEFFCKESELCESQSIGQCTRNTAAAIGCRYTARLTSGDVCRGTMHITALGGGAISNSPGVVSGDEGECFTLFEPRGVREVEEEEREEKA